MSRKSYKFAIQEMVRLRNLDLTESRFDTFNTLWKQGDVERAYQALTKAIAIRNP